MINERELLAELRRHNLLKQLLQHQIIAEAVGDVEISDDELLAARNQFLNQHGLKDSLSLNNYLDSQGWGSDDFNWQLSLPHRIKYHCRKHFLHKAEAHFLSRKNQLDGVVYSLLRVKDSFLAQELFLRIEGGESNFGDLAADFSEGPERNTKGIVGPVPMTQAHPHVAELLRTSKPGELLHPCLVGEWWLVMRLEKYSHATFDDAMAERLSHELFNQWVNEELARKMSGTHEPGVATTAE
jgi:parvulin-like peptidyl-prolyl isomerase